MSSLFCVCFTTISFKSWAYLEIGGGRGLHSGGGVEAWGGLLSAHKQEAEFEFFPMVVCLGQVIPHV